MILTDLPTPTRAQSPQRCRRRRAGVIPAAARTGASGIGIRSAEPPARRAPQPIASEGRTFRRHTPLGHRLRLAIPSGPAVRRRSVLFLPGGARPRPASAVAIHFEYLPR